MSRRRRNDEDDGDGVFDDAEDDDDDDDEENAGAKAQKKAKATTKPSASKKRKKISSMIDDAAEESGEEGGGDDDEDEEDDDDENNEYIKDGFVVDEDEEIVDAKTKDDLEDSDDDDDDEDEEGGGAGSKRPGSAKRLKKVRKLKDLDRLDEDDLALIQESQQVDRPPRPEEHVVPKSVVAKTAEELRKGLFDDEDDTATARPADKVQPKKPQERIDHYDEDGMEDFIDDDIGDQGEIMASERRSRYDDGDEEGGVNAAQLTEASEIFGADYLDFMEGDHDEDELLGKRGVLGLEPESDEEGLSDDEDLFGEDDDDDDEGMGGDGQRAEAMRLKREKRKIAKAERRRQGMAKKAEKRKAQLRRVFEPVQLVENFCTERDDEIRQADVPERLFDFATPFYGSNEDGLTEQEEAQALWIASRIPAIHNELLAAPSPSLKRKVLEAIAAALRFVHRDRLEPAFIKMYRKDYVTSPAVLDNLYLIMDEDGEWNRVIQARDKVSALLADLNRQVGDVDAGVDLQKLEELQQELEDARLKLDEVAKQESVVKADLEALGNVDDDDDDELFGDDGDKDEVR